MTAKPRLLLVEDTPSILRLYHEVLKKLDVELIDAETGARALSRLDETVPDVVLLDVELPDTNGIDILRTHPLPRNLPSAVIVVTAHGSVKTAVEAMREGAYDFIIKPFAARPPDGDGAQRARTPAVCRPCAAAADVAKDGKFRRADRRLAADARGLQCDRERGQRAAPRSSSPARAAPARSSSPRRSTT